MPSIASGRARSATSARIVHISPETVAEQIDDIDVDSVVVDDGGGAGIGRIGAALLTGATEIRTTEPAVAEQARAVVDRLLAARVEL